MKMKHMIDNETEDTHRKKCKKTAIFVQFIANVLLHKLRC